MKDNIILITTDQQRFDTIQALGNQTIFTPHLNYMVREGVSFTRCYADCPICMPSRTTIMTGEAGYHSNILGNTDHQDYMQRLTLEKKTLPARLTAHGYQTKAVGKMHFEPARANYGFEDIELVLDYMRFHDKNQNIARPKAHGLGECELEPGISTTPEKFGITRWVVDQSIDFIQTRDSLRPFFMWTSFTKPHPPFDPSMNYWELYATDKMEAPIYGDWSKTLEQTPQGFLAGTYQNTNVHYHTVEQMKTIKRAYYAMITEVDYALGHLFGCLREEGLWENTWIIFTSDHGEMLGDHHAAQKNLFFEGSAHVPMIVVPPKGRKAPRNIKVETLAQMMDVYPTIMDMAQIELKDESYEGVSLLRLNPQDQDRTFYGNSIDTHFCLMKDKLKLVYCRCGGHYLLFDLKTDPMEKQNLATEPEWQELFEQMKEELLQFIKTTRAQLVEKDQIMVMPEPKFPGDIEDLWFGFHHQDYSVDTFH